MSRIIKFLISFFYFIFIESKRIFAKILKIEITPICVTLYYHSIFANEKDRFKKQMNLIKNKTTVLKSDYFGKLDPWKRYSIITFDDGFENLIENAIPTLNELEIPFTIFFITNYFEKKPKWEMPEGHKDRNEKIMSVLQMKSIPDNLLTIGSHTANHKKLNTLSDDELWKELIDSKQALTKIVNKEITTIAFPNGEYNSSVIAKSFETGYKRVFTIDPDFSLQSPNEKITARVWTNGNDWYPEFWLKVHGGYCWLNSAFELKRKFYG